MIVLGQEVQPWSSYTVKGPEGVLASRVYRHEGTWVCRRLVCDPQALVRFGC